MRPEPLLAVRDLVCRFPAATDLIGRTRAWVRAVDGASFAVEAGTTLALVGESGSGKTTVARAVCRLIDPAGGSIAFAGEDLLGASPARLRALRRQIQMVFQDPYASLNPRRRVGAIIGEAFVVHGLLDAAARRQQVAELIELVGLRAEAAARFPHEFSGGQRQRIAIARALALNPALIVADEPVSALDVSIQAQILNLLVALQAQHGLAYLFISHDLRVVQHVSDRTAVMYLGRIVEIGPTRAVFRRPAHPYTASLIAAAPRLEGGGARRLIEGEIPSPIAPPPGCHFHTRCPRRQPRCTAEAPALEARGDGRAVACFYPDD